MAEACQCPIINSWGPMFLNLMGTGGRLKWDVRIDEEPRGWDLISAGNKGFKEEGN
jgi:hypothetical protein